MRNYIFEPEALAQFTEWAIADKKKFLKIGNLLKEILRTPFDGTGKAEPLKGDLAVIGQEGLMISIA